MAPLRIINLKITSWFFAQVGNLCHQILGGRRNYLDYRSSQPPPYLNSLPPKGRGRQKWTNLTGGFGMGSLEWVLRLRRRGWEKGKYMEILKRSPWFETMGAD
jgi:hypothetical protein